MGPQAALSVKLQQIGQILRAITVHPSQGVFIDLVDLVKPDLPIQKGFYGNFIGGIENGATA